VYESNSLDNINNIPLNLNNFITIINFQISRFGLVSPASSSSISGMGGTFGLHCSTRKASKLGHFTFSVKKPTVVQAYF
jgi:hypothetical protein